MESVGRYLEEVWEQPHEVLDLFLLVLNPRRRVNANDQVPWAAEWLLKKGLVSATFEKPKNRGIHVRLEPTDLGRAVGELITAI
ncbi:MAG TPA: hypothetical protein VNZ52_13180 [Candidatus Thermoplasmatota archaeon]|nr:hypothetical protein [Candidatus Thermoplasmatota archaeon]